MCFQLIFNYNINDIHHFIVNETTGVLPIFFQSSGLKIDCRTFPVFVKFKNC